MNSVPEMGRSPGEGMAIHFSSIAWEIPWTEEPGVAKESDMAVRNLK